MTLRSVEPDTKDIRIGFAIISHQNPDQTERLVNILRTGCPTCAVVVHHDPRGPRLARSLHSIAGVTVLPDAVHVDWADWSQVQAMLRCFRHLLDQEPDVDWLVLISGQDYPVRSLKEFQAFLASSDADAHLQFSRVPLYGATNDDLQRYSLRWRRLPSWSPSRFLPRRLPVLMNRAQNLVKMYTHTRSGDWIGVRLGRHPFSEGFPLYKGSYWCELRRSAAEELILAEDSDLVTWFRHTIHPDEAWLLTVLLNNKRIRVSHDLRRFDRFAYQEAAHPDLLGSDDISEVAASGAFFGRKFDERGSSEVLDFFDKLALS